MRPIYLGLPAGAVEIGQILDDYAGATLRLSEDILQVTLPSGYVIDVGWYPAFDPAGRFRIVVFSDDFDNPVTDPVEAVHPHDAASVVRELAERFSPYQDWTGVADSDRSYGNIGDIGYYFVGA